MWLWFLSELSIGALKGMNVSSGHVSVIQMKGEMSLCVLGGLVEQTEKTESACFLSAPLTVFVLARHLDPIYLINMYVIIICLCKHTWSFNSVRKK